MAGGHRGLKIGWPQQRQNVAQPFWRMLSSILWLRSRLGTLLSALSWRLLCYFLPSWHVLGPIFCHFGRPRPPKNHEFPRDGHQNHAFRCIRVGCRVGPLLGVAWPLLGGSRPHFASLLGPPGTLLGASWGLLGGFLALSWGSPGASWGNFVSKGHLKASWGPPGASGKRPERLLGVSWGLPGDLRSFLETSCFLAP